MQYRPIKRRFKLSNPYTAQVGLNHRRFGPAVVTPNWNEANQDPTIIATMVADLIRLAGGSVTGIQAEILIAFDGWTNQSDVVSSTSKFVAGVFDRGWMLLSTGVTTATIRLSGFNAGAAVLVYLGFDSTSSSYTTERFDYSITDGAGTLDGAADTKGLTAELGGFAVVANGSGIVDIVLTLDAAFPTNNGCSLCGIYFEFEE